MIWNRLRPLIDELLPSGNAKFQAELLAVCGIDWEGTGVESPSPSGAEPPSTVMEWARDRTIAQDRFRSSTERVEQFTKLLDSLEYIRELLEIITNGIENDLPFPEQEYGTAEPLLHLVGLSLIYDGSGRREYVPLNTVRHFIYLWTLQMGFRRWRSKKKGSGRGVTLDSLGGNRLIEALVIPDELIGKRTKCIETEWTPIDLYTGLFELKHFRDREGSFYILDEVWDLMCLYRDALLNGIARIATEQVHGEVLALAGDFVAWFTPVMSDAELIGSKKEKDALLDLVSLDIVERLEFGEKEKEIELKKSELREDRDIRERQQNSAERSDADVDELLLEKNRVNARTEVGRIQQKMNTLLQTRNYIRARRRTLYGDSSKVTGEDLYYLPKDERGGPKASTPAAAPSETGGTAGGGTPSPGSTPDAGEGIDDEEEAIERHLDEVEQNIERLKVLLASIESDIRDSSSRTEETTASAAERLKKADLRAIEQLLAIGLNDLKSQKQKFQYMEKTGKDPNQAWYFSTKSWYQMNSMVSLASCTWTRFPQYVLTPAELKRAAVIRQAAIGKVRVTNAVKFYKMFVSDWLPLTRTGFSERESFRMHADYFSDVISVERTRQRMWRYGKEIKNVPARMETVLEMQEKSYYHRELMNYIGIFYLERLHPEVDLYRTVLHLDLELETVYLGRPTELLSEQPLLTKLGAFWAIWALNWPGSGVRIIGEDIFHAFAVFERLSGATLHDPGSGIDYPFAFVESET